MKPLARIVSSAVTGCPPELMGIGPISSTKLVLQRSGWEIGDVEIFEINEAFSSQSLAVINELSIDRGKVNIDGGAISIGHPLGASGARIVGKADLYSKGQDRARPSQQCALGAGWESQFHSRESRQPIGRHIQGTCLFP